MSQARAMENQYDLSHLAGHIVSALAVLGSWVGVLPAIAAFVALIWYTIQIYESRTVQTWLRKRREHKLARLQRALDAMLPPKDCP